MSTKILIVGASARAAAWSARIAGYEIEAADLFADADLQSICSVEKVDDYPHGLSEIIRRTDADVWMYTGGLENHPTLIAAMARQKPLWGNSSDTLQHIRDPNKVADALRQAGLMTPRIASSTSQLSSGSWLQKPRRSCGGRDIVRVTSMNAISGNECIYWQEYVEGLPCSAVFVAAAGRARLLGATRQLIGDKTFGASGFQYCGSLGLLQLSISTNDQLARVGNCLAERFALVGLFGLDFILHGDDVWPVEVNPRYVASIEVIERAVGLRTIEHHAAGCRGELLPVVNAPTESLICGKAIVFARQDVVVNSAVFQWLQQNARADNEPRFADIPTAGTSIGRGQPIATVLAQGVAECNVLDELRRYAIELGAKLSS